MKYCKIALLDQNLAGDPDDQEFLENEFQGQFFSQTCAQLSHDFM